MAGGPLYPISVYVGNAAGNLFPNFYAGSGSNLSTHDEGIGVVASFAAAFGSGTAELRFPMPPAIPTGTAKIRDLVLANATTGAHVFTYLVGAVSGGGDPSAVTLFSNAQQNVSFGATSAGKYQETKSTIATYTPVANDIVVVALAINSGGNTLAQVATHVVTWIWE